MNTTLSLIVVVASFSLMVYLFYKLLKIHKHEFVQVGFRQAEDRYSRYSIRKYQCMHCGHTKEVDGRFDKN